MITSTTTMEPPPLDEFVARAQEWLAANAELRPERVERVWGEGSDSVAVFHNMSFDDEKALIDEARAWQQRKADAGLASIDWATEFGGAGLPSAYARAFAREESRYLTPASHEAMGITLELIGPTIRAWGSADQTARFLNKLRRTEEMWCQLFSEPGAGSDLARLSTRAVRDGDEWVIDGQKVWTSGARHADYGYIICRTDPEFGSVEESDTDDSILDDNPALETAIDADDAAEDLAQSTKANTIQSTQTSPHLTAMNGNVIEEATTFRTDAALTDIITDLDADVRSGIVQFDQ